MIFLSKEQVEELNYKQCVQQMKLITKTYNLEKPLTECWTEVWPVLDELTNTILYLEDRITKFEDPRIASMDMEA
jgi:hypothetical protein